MKSIKVIEILQSLVISIVIVLEGPDFKEFFSFLFWNAMKKCQLTFIEPHYSTFQDC